MRSALADSRPFDRFESAVSEAVRAHGVTLLRVSLAIVFVWFGALKLAGTSPAEELVAKTVFWFPPKIFVPVLGVWEVAIGLGLLLRPWLRAGLALMFLQMPGTALPLFLRPEVCFTHWPFGLTIEGQYIVKNLVLVSAAIVIAGTVTRRREGASTALPTAVLDGSERENHPWRAGSQSVHATVRSQSVRAAGAAPASPARHSRDERMRGALPSLRSKLAREARQGRLAAKPRGGTQCPTIQSLRRRRAKPDEGRS